MTSSITIACRASFSFLEKKFFALEAATIVLQRCSVTFVYGGSTRAHHFFLDITFHSLYTFNQLQQNTVAIHEKWKGRIDSWQPRRKPRRKRNTKHEQEETRGRGKRPLSFCAGICSFQLESGPWRLLRNQCRRLKADSVFPLSRSRHSPAGLSYTAAPRLAHILSDRSGLVQSFVTASPGFDFQL
jgi:hypothetical protein